MRPIHPLRPLCRHTPPRRTITTAPGTFANLRYELLARPPKCYYDYLTPTNSHLLSLTLADQLLPVPAPQDNHRHHHPGPSSDLDHWTLPNVHRRGALLPADPLPQGHHLVYFPPTHPSSALLADGTDADHWPGPPFTRRLWAGGAVSFAEGWEANLLLDKRRAACVERVEDVRLSWARVGSAAAAGVAQADVDGDAQGGGVDGTTLTVGDKVFVDVVRRYAPVGEGDEDAVGGAEVVRRVEEDPAIVERRTLVFLTGRADEGGSGSGKPRSSSAKPKHKKQVYQDPEHVIPFTATPAVLFRFSALSFNAHAIHLDPAHCRATEGYERPLVHGPLLLVLMFSALRAAALAGGRSPPSATGLEYMNLQPVFVGERMRVCVRTASKKWHVWVEGEDGRLCVKGSAKFA